MPAVFPHDPTPCEPSRRGRQQLAFHDVHDLASVALEDIQLLIVSCRWRGVSGLVLMG
jgi:hypothetical protein